MADVKIEQPAKAIEAAPPAFSRELIDPRKNRCRLVAPDAASLEDLVKRKLAAGWTAVK